ncbi:MAG: metallophosphoesterase family protein [Sphingomonadaceae bacterium]
MTHAASRLFHVSDVHFGVEDQAALDWFAQAVAVERPDAVICTGDLTQRATHRQYARAAEWFAELKVPVMLQPGNHDMPYYNMWERFRRPYARYGRLAAAVGSEISLANALIVPFDTNVRVQLRWPWSDGVVRRRKLDAALARLEQLRGDPRPKLVACHHPLLPAEDGRRNPTVRGDLAFAALAAAGASAVLSGHVHRPFDMVRARGNRPLRMIGAGTLSTRLRGAEPSYNAVSIGADGTITVEQRDFVRS